MVLAAHAVAEVDAPRQRSGDAVGAVGESGEKTADAANGGADGEGVNEQIAGGAVQAEEAFGQFHAGPAAEEAAHDGFAAEEGTGIVAKRPVEGGALRPGEGLGGEPGAEDAADEEPEIFFQREGGLG